MKSEFSLLRYFHLKRRLFLTAHVPRDQFDRYPFSIKSVDMSSVHLNDKVEDARETIEGMQR